MGEPIADIVDVTGASLAAGGLEVKVTVADAEESIVGFVAEVPEDKFGITIVVASVGCGAISVILGAIKDGRAAVVSNSSSTTGISVAIVEVLVPL